MGGFCSGALQPHVGLTLLCTHTQTCVCVSGGLERGVKGVSGGLNVEGGHMIAVS